MRQTLEEGKCRIIILQLLQPRLPVTHYDFPAGGACLQPQRTRVNRYCCLIPAALVQYTTVSLTSYDDLSPEIQCRHQPVVLYKRQCRIRLRQECSSVLPGDTLRARNHETRGVMSRPAGAGLASLRHFLDVGKHMQKRSTAREGRACRGCGQLLLQSHAQCSEYASLCATTERTDYKMPHDSHHHCIKPTRSSQSAGQSASHQLASFLALEPLAHPPFLLLPGPRLTPAVVAVTSPPVSSTIKASRIPRSTTPHHHDPPHGKPVRPSSTCHYTANTMHSLCRPITPCLGGDVDLSAEPSDGDVALPRPRRPWKALTC